MPARYSFKKPWIRSRASGGTCGDSIAASSAATMSSFRRRAICVQRAMSTERSSTGGRASARTTAAASVGSASSRNHASTSRISARRKNAVSPTTRWATARSSSATATACPSREIAGTSTAIWPGDTPSPAISRSTSAAADWAWARSLAQRQNATSPSAEVGSHEHRHRGRGRSEHPARDAQALLERDHVREPRVAHFAFATRRVGRDGQPRPGHRPAPASPKPDRDRAHRPPARARIARTAGRSRTTRSASRIRSPASRAPASASICSWTR